MKSAAVAELKANLSKYLAHVKAGEQVLVTDRGVPVAKLVSVDTRNTDLSGHLQDLEKAGLAIIGSGKLPKSFWEWERPVDKKGRAVKSLIQERSRER
jgi:prevent-host-death family protein